MHQDANAGAGANANSGTDIEFSIDDTPANARGFLPRSVAYAWREPRVIALGLIGRDSENARENGGDCDAP